jgi:hypothetical protein
MAGDAAYYFNPKNVCLIGNLPDLYAKPADCLKLRHRIFDRRAEDQPVCGTVSVIVGPGCVIDLESAAFVFHINGTTQGITGSLRAACSEPVQRFLACPFS